MAICIHTYIFHIPGNCPPLTIKSASSLRNGKVALCLCSVAKSISPVANNCSIFIISSSVGLKNCSKLIIQLCRITVLQFNSQPQSGYKQIAYHIKINSIEFRTIIRGTGWSLGTCWTRSSW